MMADIRTRGFCAIGLERPKADDTAKQISEAVARMGAQKS
jgi:hypothetical protein